MNRRIFLSCAALLSLGGQIAAAETFPARPIHLIVGFSAGGSTDSVARLIGKGLSDQMGQPVVVENRPGAGGEIALQYVSKAAPDGYTLLLVTASSSTLGLVRKVPFDIERDFAPIAEVAVSPQILTVNPSLPAKDVAQLVALARKEPGKLTYGTSGVGTPSHLAGVMFDQIGKVTTTHVPYKGSSENILAVAAGNISMSYTDATSVLPLLQAGKVRAIGVTTAQRVSFLPDVPTLDESGLKGLILPLWFGVSAPANTPQAVVQRLGAAIQKTMSTPVMKVSLNKLGIEPQYAGVDAFKAFIHGELKKNAELIKLSGMKTTH
jgi:tripartite-type tricarboxylate transporter receptor subunit TctC